MQQSTVSSTNECHIESAPSDTFSALRDVVSLYHERAAVAGGDGILVLLAVRPNLEEPNEGEKKPKEEKEVHHFEIGDVEGMIRKAIELREFGNIWLGPALYRRGISSRSRGRKEDIIAVLGLVIDDDGDTDKRAIRPKGIAETIEITTATKPAVNLQPHFVFTRALSPDEANGLADLLGRKCGGDHGTKDISHVWRLPDLLNFPNRKKLGRGRPIEPQEVALTGGSWELIDPDDLRRELESMPDPDPPKDKKKRKAKSNGSSGNGYAPPMGSVHPDDLPLPDWLARDIYTEDTDDRSKHCCKTMLHLMERNLGDDAIRYYAHKGRFANKYIERGDLDGEIARVRENVWTGEIKFDLLAFHNKQQGTAANGASNGSVHGRANSEGKTMGVSDSTSTADAPMPLPDMAILKRNLEGVPEFPVDALGQAGAWVKASAAGKCAPIDYVALGLLVGTAGCIGPRRRAAPWETWTEPAVLWGSLVGSPSTNKSPALDDLREAIALIERERNRDWDQRYRQHETDKLKAETSRSLWEVETKKAVKENKDPPLMPSDAVVPDAPTKRRLLIVDATTEKVAHLLAENPGGLICHRDEMSGLLGSFDKYGGAGSDVAFWLEAYGGRFYRHDRVALKGESIDIPFCAVSLIGGIQPDKLDKMLISGVDDGLQARPIYAWPDSVRPKRPDGANPPDNAALASALRRLCDLKFGEGDDGELHPKLIFLESEAADEFAAWWMRTQWDAKDNAKGSVAGAIGKLDGVALRLSLVLEYMAWAWGQSNQEEPEKVSLGSVNAAIEIIEQWIKPNIARVFNEAALPKVQKDAIIVGHWLVKQKDKPKLVNARDLRRTAGFPGPKDAKELDAALDVLVDASWLIPQPQPSNSPRRRRKDFLVNPAIYEELH